METLDDNECLALPQPILLGVLGHRQDITYDILYDKIITPILSELGRMPDRVILPSEATSSALLYGWAEKFKLSLIAYETDWNRLGRKARAVRDARITQESTHFIIFLGKRSEYYDQHADKIARKGKTVFTVSNEFELEQVVIERDVEEEVAQKQKPITREEHRPSSRRQPPSSCPQKPPSSVRQPSLASWLQQRSPLSSSSPPAGSESR